MSVVAFIGRDAASNGSFSFLPLNRAFLSRRVYLKSQYYSFSISVVLKSNIISTALGKSVVLCLFLISLDTFLFYNLSQ